MLAVFVKLRWPETSVEVSLTFSFVLFILQLLEQCFFEVQNRNLVLLIQLQELSFQPDSSDAHEHHSWRNEQILLLEVLGGILFESIELCFANELESSAFESSFELFLPFDEPVSGQSHRTVLSAESQGNGVTLFFLFVG